MVEDARLQQIKDDGVDASWAARESAQMEMENLMSGVTDSVSRWDHVCYVLHFREYSMSVILLA